MAITKILTLGESNSGKTGRHLKNAIDYILEPKKTQEGRYVSGWNCQPEKAFVQMMETKESFGKTDKRQGYHLILSFEEKKLDPALAFEITGRFVQEFLGTEYEAVYAVHDNTAHTHGHIIFNSVNCITGKKYRYEKGDWAKLIQPVTNRLCEEYGLSKIEIEVEDKKNKKKDRYPGKGEQSVRVNIIRRDIDACIIQVSTFEEFLERMQEMGYETKQGKYLAVRPKGMDRFCRCKGNTLGEDYTAERIRERIAEHGREQGNQVLEDVFLTETKWTGIQRNCDTKECRIRQLELLPYSETWKYRKELWKLEKTQERYLFLLRNDIHDISGLLKVKESLFRKQREADRKRRELLRKKKQLSPLFVKLERRKKLLLAENRFQEGEDFFLREHEEYVRLTKELEQEGYTAEMLEQLQRKLEQELSGVHEKHKAVRKEWKLAEAMTGEFLENFEEAVAEREKQPEQGTEKKEEKGQQER